jgi:DNA-3-methyladenine glycosylase II
MRTAVRHLRSVDPVMDGLIARIGRCGLKVDRAGQPYQALVRAIAYQQLHANAARCILARFCALYPGVDFPTPGMVLATPDTALRGAGFSAGKVAAILDIAAKTAAGVVPTRRAAAGLDDNTLIERLTEIRGVGRWTVEMVLIFTLGRPDVLPVDDFGVRDGYRRMHGLDEQPRPRDLAAIGEMWAPFRSTAAWYLWRAADEGKQKAAPASSAPGSRYQRTLSAAPTTDTA